MKIKTLKKINCKDKYKAKDRLQRDDK